MTSPLPFFDRSRADQDDVCERSRFWLTEAGGTGLSPRSKPAYFDFGDIVARAHHEIRAGHVDLDARVAQAGREAFQVGLRTVPDLAPPGLDEQRGQEYQDLAEALLTGFYTTVWPLLMQEYRVIGTEQELTVDYEGVRFGCRPDLILQRLSDGTYGYPDDKTTADVSPAWFESWEQNVQLMSGARAIRASIGLDVSWVMVLGLYKGYVERKTGDLVSPLVYGWRTADAGVGTVTRYSAKRPSYWKGWERFRVRDAMTVRAWLDLLGPAEVSRNFPVTRPIRIREDLVEAWFRQRAVREKEIALASVYGATVTGAEREAVMDTHFRQNFKACKPWRKSPCPYNDLCWIEGAADNPKAYGFVTRRPHHDSDPLWREED